MQERRSLFATRRRRYFFGCFNHRSQENVIPSDMLMTVRLSCPEKPMTVPTRLWENRRIALQAQFYAAPPKNCPKVTTLGSYDLGPLTDYSITRPGVRVRASLLVIAPRFTAN